MLQKTKQLRSATARGGHFAIVASTYNALYVDTMVEAAKTRLQSGRVKSVEVTRVPGAYEIPVVTSALLKRRRGKLSAVICLGVIIRGQTAHAQLIADAVTRALMEIQLAYHVPVIHEVLLVENEEQARKRCLDKEFNRGLEAADTALEMAAVMRNFRF